MTRQERREIFLKVKIHLLSQNQKSLDCAIKVACNSASCMYRGMNGLKCAVGCLISDEFYDKDLENGSVGPEVMGAVCKSLGIDSQYDELLRIMLQRLQTVHDQNKPEYWDRELDLIEGRFIQDNIISAEVVA